MKEVKIHEADELIVCMNSADAKHIRETFPFDDYDSVAIVSSKDSRLRDARQDADVYLVANGSGPAAGQELANWLGKPIYCFVALVEKLDGAGLVEALEAAMKITPDGCGGTTAAIMPPPLTKSTVAGPHSAESPMDATSPCVEINQSAKMKTPAKILVPLREKRQAAAQGERTPAVLEASAPQGEAPDKR